MHDTYDFIIVGAGSAGCVLANRLSENGRYTVLLLEAGGSDRRLWIRVPIGYGRTFFDPRVNWCYRTQSERGLDGRRNYWPRGKVLGGSSSINALCYVRGLPGDYDDWHAQGNPDWAWSDVAPWFERIERRVRADGSSVGSGPLWVSDPSDGYHPLRHEFARAATELGLPLCEDFNGAHPEGLGHYQITVRNGLRCSAADAFLHPARNRANLRVCTHAHAQRILFEGSRARGVEFRRRGALRRVRAAREVILSAGVIGSPQLLQLSGVGPAALLRGLGIAVVDDKPAVGANLQDHLAVTYGFRSRVPTLNDELAPWWGKLKAGLRYLAARNGPLALSVNQCGGFVRSRPGLRQPDLQLYCSPISYTALPDAPRPTLRLDRFAGFILSFQPCRPSSRGRIDIASPDPAYEPLIRPDYLSTDKDAQDVVAGGRLLRDFARTAAMHKVIESAAGADLRTLSDTELLADFRRRASTVFHPVGTCAMGPDAGTAAVDAQLRVHGLHGLRVIDASVFPNVTSGNTNAPTLMLACKSAEYILRAAAPA